MSFWHQDFNIAKQSYSLGGMPHVLNVWMFECCSEYSYKNIQPTTEEMKINSVSVSLLKNLVILALPPREILIKADFASPISPDHPLKKRKTVMFEQDSQAVMDDDTSGSDHPVHHVSDLYSETHKDAADKGKIGVSEIQHHHHGEIGVSSESPA
ncbi:hypothetical protein P3S68_018932 [Capsicum galapagoense]